MRRWSSVSSTAASTWVSVSFSPVKLTMPFSFWTKAHRGCSPVKARHLEDVVHRIADEAAGGGDVDQVAPAHLELVDGEQVGRLRLSVDVGREELVDVGGDGERAAVALVGERNRAPALAGQPAEVTHRQPVGKVRNELIEVRAHGPPLPARQRRHVGPHVPRKQAPAAGRRGPFERTRLARDPGGDRARSVAGSPEAAPSSRRACRRGRPAPAARSARRASRARSRIVLGFGVPMTLTGA